MYIYRPLPWFSKSTIISEDFCEWLFKLRYLDKIDTGMGMSAHIGVNMHAVADKFFKEIDYNYLADIPINYEEYLSNTRVYQYMFKTCMEMIPVESRGFSKYKTIIDNFSMIEAQHWIDLNQQFKGAIGKVMKYFVPQYCEKYVEYKDALLFGTVDRKSIHYEEKNEYHEVYDYKTGHVPKSVKRGLRTPGDDLSWDLPTNKMFELHFYIILDLAYRGYKLNPELVDYITNPKYFKEGTKVPLVDHYFEDTKGRPYDFTDEYHVGIIYLGDDLPYVPKKRSSKKSMRAVIRRINKLRTKIHQNYAFQKDINYWKCKNCTILEKCLNEEEQKLLGLGEEDI